MELNAVYTQLGILFLTVLTGYILGKIKLITPQAAKLFATYVLNVALPAFLLTGMQVPFSWERLHTSLSVLALSVPCYALAYLTGVLTAKVLARKDSGRKAIFRFGAVFANTAFLGFPVFQALYGQEALFYAAVYNIPFGFLLYTLGVKIMSSGKQEFTRKLIFKMVFNPGVVASIIGFILFLTALPLPLFLKGAIDSVGNTCVPLSMLTIGAMLSGLPLRQMFNDPGIYLFSLVRLAVMPALTLILVRYAFGLQDMWLIAIPVIMAGMPVASNTVLMAVEYENNAPLASQTVLISTLFSCLTIPLLVYVLQNIL